MRSTTMILLLIILNITAETKAASDQQDFRWIKDEKIRAAFVSWSGSVENSRLLVDNGINTAVYYFNRLCSPTAPDDPNDFSVNYDAVDETNALKGWLEGRKETGLHVFACINSYAGVEARMFGGDKKRYRRLVNKEGESPNMPCPTDEALWSYLTKNVTYLAKTYPGLEGVVIDLETYNGGPVYPNYGSHKYRVCYCDNCFGEFLESKGVGGGKIEKADRWKWLADNGFLADYFDALEKGVENRAREMNERVRQVREDIILGALWYDRDNWFCNGYVKGLGANETPILVFSESEYGQGYGSHTEENKKRIAQVGVKAYYVGGLMLSSFESWRIAGQAYQLSRFADGYWLFCANTLFYSSDQLKKARPPWDFKEGTRNEYLAAFRSVGKKTEAGLPRTDDGPLKMAVIDVLPLMAKGGDVSLEDEPSENMIQNGGFESWTQPRGPDAWGTPYYYAVKDANYKTEGDYSVRCYGYPHAGISQAAGIKGGDLYALLFDFRTNDAGYAYFGTDHSDIPMRWRTSPKWQSFFQTLQTEKDTEVTISLRVWRHYDPTDTAWYDNVRVVRCSKAVFTSAEIRPNNLGVWDKLIWEANVPADGKITVDVIDPTTERELLRNAESGADLSFITHIYTRRAIKVRCTLIAADEKVQLESLKVGYVSADISSKGH